MAPSLCLCAVYTTIALVTVTIADNNRVKFSASIYPPFSMSNPKTANTLMMPLLYSLAFNL